eukprot:6201521-Pleurochrysis_carterae.AAC.4
MISKYQDLGRGSVGSSMIGAVTSRSAVIGVSSRERSRGIHAVGPSDIVGGSCPSQQRCRLSVAGVSSGHVCAGRNREVKTKVGLLTLTVRPIADCGLDSVDQCEDHPDSVDVEDLFA